MRIDFFCNRILVYLHIITNIANDFFHDFLQTIVWHIVLSNGVEDITRQHIFFTLCNTHLFFYFISHSSHLHLEKAAHTDGTVCKSR